MSPLIASIHAVRVAFTENPDSLKASIGAIGPSIRSQEAPTGVSLYEPLGILDGGRLRLEKQTRLAARFEKTCQKN